MTTLKRNRQLIFLEKNKSILETNKSNVIDSIIKVLSLPDNESVEFVIEEITSILIKLDRLHKIDNYAAPKLFINVDLKQKLLDSNKNELLSVCYSNIHLDMTIRVDSKNYEFRGTFINVINGLKQIKPLDIDSSHNLSSVFTSINKLMFVIMTLIIDQLKLACIKHMSINFLDVITDDEVKDEYEVESIVDRKVENRKIQYLVKWKGYDDSQNSWEPRENLANCEELIESYYEGEELRFFQPPIV